MRYATGYFGIPGSQRTKDNTKVHIVATATPTLTCSRPAPRPVCGASLRPGMQFQWCAVSVHEDYVECQRCLKMSEMSQDERTASQRKSADLFESMKVGFVRQVLLTPVPYKVGESQPAPEPAVWWTKDRA